MVKSYGVVVVVGGWPMRFYCHRLGLGVLSILYSQVQGMDDSWFVFNLQCEFIVLHCWLQNILKFVYFINRPVCYQWI